MKLLLDENLSRRIVPFCRLHFQAVEGMSSIELIAQPQSD